MDEGVLLIDALLYVYVTSVSLLKSPYVSLTHHMFYLRQSQFSSSWFTNPQMNRFHLISLIPISIRLVTQTSEISFIARLTSRLEEELTNNPLALHSSEHKSLPLIRRAKLVAASTVSALGIELVQVPLPISCHSIPAIALGLFPH